MSQEKNPLKIGGLVIAVFGIVGFGLGLTGYIGVDWIQGVFTTEGSENVFGGLLVGLILLQSVLVTFLNGPTVAALTGLVTGTITKSQKRAAAINGAGTFVGFYIMVAVAIVVMTMAFDGGSGSGGSSGSAFNMGQAMTAAAKAGIPTAAVGVAAGYLGGSFNAIDVSVSRNQAAGSTHSDD